jgi:hypothetical protein
VDLTSLYNLILGIVPSIFSIVIIWYSRKYLNDRYRNKIIRVLFKKRKVKLKNGQNINIDLQKVLNSTNFSKFSYKLLFFVIAYIFFFPILGINRSLTYFLGFSPLFFILVAFFYIITIFLLSPVANIIFHTTKNPPNITETNKYTSVKWTKFTPFDFVVGWMFFTYFFLLIYLSNYAILSSYWEQLLLDYLGISLIFLVMPIIYILTGLIAKKDEGYDDLAASIFSDFKQQIDTNLNIFVYTAGGFIKGKIIDIGNELTLEDIDSVGNITVYVPWENIVFFKIIEP